MSKIDGTRHEYIFNSENRMTAYRKYDISSTLLTTADYFYDAPGRRIAKTIDGALTRYMYNEEDIWLAITPDGTAVHYHHGPGIDEPLVAWMSFYDGIGKYWGPLYYFADGLGSIRAAKGHDWAGRDMSATYEFDSFGQLMSSTSTLKAEWPLFTFTAREADSESNLLYFRYRYYDPRGGRFVGVDPIMSRESSSQYAYVKNSPVVLVEPYGLKGISPGACVVTWILAGAEVGAAAGATAGGAGGLVLAGVGAIPGGAAGAGVGAAAGGLIGGLIGVFVCAPPDCPPFPLPPPDEYEPKRTTCKGLLQSCLNGYLTGPCYTCARMCDAGAWPYYICPGSGKK